VDCEPPYGYSQQSQPWPEQPPSSYPPSYGPEVSYPPPPAYPSQPLYPPPSVYPSQPLYPPPAAYPAQPLYPPPPPPSYPSQAAPGQSGMYPPMMYAQPYGVPMPFAPPDPAAGMATASLVLGIISLAFTVLFLCGGLFVAPVTAILGIVMGVLGRKSYTRHGNAVAGLVMSIIALVIAGGMLALYFIVLAFPPPTSTSSFDL
jgi:hypothetical protein